MKYFWRTKYRRRKIAQERCQNFTKEEKEKRFHYYKEHKKKVPEYRRSYDLTQRSNYLVFFKDPKTIRFASRTSSWNFWEFLKFAMGLKILLLQKTFLKFFFNCLSLLDFPLMVTLKYTTVVLLKSSRW